MFTDLFYDGSYQTIVRPNYKQRFLNINCDLILFTYKMGYKLCIIYIVYFTVKIDRIINGLL